jgi:hypothetical protein
MHDPNDVMGDLEQVQNAIIISFSAHFAMVMVMAGRITKSPELTQAYNSIVAAFIEGLASNNLEARVRIVEFYTCIDRANHILHWLLIG